MVQARGRWAEHPHGRPAVGAVEEDGPSLSTDAGKPDGRRGTALGAGDRAGGKRTAGAGGAGEPTGRFVRARGVLGHGGAVSGEQPDARPGVGGAYRRLRARAAVCAARDGASRRDGRTGRTGAAELHHERTESGQTAAPGGGVARPSGQGESLSAQSVGPFGVWRIQLRRRGAEFALGDFRAVQHPRIERRGARHAPLRRLVRVQLQAGE